MVNDKKGYLIIPYSKRIILNNAKNKQFAGVKANVIQLRKQLVRSLELAD